MSEGPPFTSDNEKKREWPNWREMTDRLDYPGRDIRIIFPGQREETLERFHIQPPDFGDFDPNPNDPDPEVWPLKGIDPGHPARVHRLIQIRNTVPQPHVAWVTEEYLIARYGYNPVRQKVDIEELPEWHQPEYGTEDGTVELTSTNRSKQPMKLTDDRLEALNRLARLWNGETVQGHHLLLDKLPSWMDIFDGLDQEELKRFVIDPEVNVEFAEAFGEHDWYEDEQDVFTKPTRILRKKVWYTPTERCRTLINKHDDITSLHGDPFEGLAHRVAVGLTTLRELQQDRKVGTYHDLGSYNVDVVSKDVEGQIHVGEVMTGHNNWKLHRQTYRKMRDLYNRGCTPYVVFDSRKTAYKILNHWHNQELAELPRGTFNSEYRIDKGRERVQEAYEDDGYAWIVSDWTTTSALWRNTLGRDAPEHKTRLILSHNW